MSLPLVTADSAFLSGLSHLETAKPCQDYALAHAEGSRGCGVVADGCSTGGKTDVGARMWAHAALKVLEAEGVQALDDVALLASKLIEQAAPLLAPFDFEDGFATLGLLATDGLRTRAVLYGDGVVAAVTRDGDVLLWVVTYQDNAPRYLNYERRPTAALLWRQTFGAGDLREVRMTYGVETASTFTADGQFNLAQGELKAMEIATSIAAEVVGVAIDVPDMANIQAVFVFTDGIQTLSGQTDFQSVEQFCQIHSAAGEFMQRRVASLSRKWRKLSKAGPRDDLGVAALWFA